MGRAREQTKGATFLKNISQWLEHGKTIFKTIFKKFLSPNVKKAKFCSPIFAKK